jgi:hypothetical protein
MTEAETIFRIDVVQASVQERPLDLPETDDEDWRSASVGNFARMDSAAAIVLVLLVVLPAVLVGGLFVWAALKDGQEDRALQARRGIRRRTRLGR